MASRTIVRLAARQRAAPLAQQTLFRAFAHTEAVGTREHNLPAAPKPFGSDISPRDMLTHLNDVAFSAYKSNASPGLFGTDSIVAQLALTHESWGHGGKGHNRRFAFLGRRAITSSLNIFLYELASGSGDAAEFARSVMVDTTRMESALDTRSLGARAGRELRLEKVMRWQPTMVRSC